MFRFSGCSLLVLVLVLVLLRGARRGAAEDCSGDAFRSGSDDFVLDAADAVQDGATLLATHNVTVDEHCERFCCEDPRCNLALLEPRDADVDVYARTCVLFDCLHRNRFVCRFVNQAGYQSYMRQSMYQRYLSVPGEGASTN